MGEHWLFVWRWQRAETLAEANRYAKLIRQSTGIIIEWPCAENGHIFDLGRTVK